MEAVGLAVCTVGVVVLLVSGGKPGCSYRGFPQPTLSTPCDPGIQSGRPGSLSRNQSDQSWASSHLGSTRELGGELNEDLYILLFDLQKDYISVFMMLNQTYYGVFPISKKGLDFQKTCF